MNVSGGRECGVLGVSICLPFFCRLGDTGFCHTTTCRYIALCYVSPFHASSFVDPDFEKLAMVPLTPEERVKVIGQPV